MGGRERESARTCGVGGEMEDDGLFDFLEKNFGKNVDRATGSTLAKG